MSKPNIIVIMADQLRADLIKPEITPNISQLFSESTVFTRAYCNSPLCVPARGAFFTGRYPNETGCLINPWEPTDAQAGQVKAGVPSLYSLFENEWDSWMTGKQHYITEDRIDKQPDAKTHWLGSEKGYGTFVREAGKKMPGGPAFRGHMPEMAAGKFTRKREYSIPTTGCYPEGLEYYYDGHVLRQSLQAIDQRDKDKPFMLNAMFYAPHPPLEIPEPWFSKFQEIPLPENVGTWAKDQSPLQLYNLGGFLASRYARDDWKEIWRVYAGLVNLLDHCIGEILAKLKTEGLYDNAIIVFTTDHGEMLGSHCSWQKMTCYEEAVQVPFSLKLPQGTRFIPSTDELASHIDFLPTMGDLTGIALPTGLPGKSLKNLAEKGESLNREAIFIQTDGNGALGNFGRSVVKGDYKLIVDMFQYETYLELYNLKRDPQEMTNLAFEDQGTVEKMLPILTKHMADTGDHIQIKPNIYRQFLENYSNYRK